MAQILVVGPGSTAQDRMALDAAVGAVRAEGHDATSLPADCDGAQLRRSIQGADGLVALLDEPLSPEVLLCLGYGVAFRRAMVGLRSDSRPGPIPAVKSLLSELVPVTRWTDPAWQERLAAALARVRVYAGNLVRDAVPKILETEGKPLRFRQAATDEYPAILKRKLVETAQALEETEWGLEQETIADLLEVLETFLNVRAYDRESLRSIKEGKWRKRGGFQKGYLVDEEPRLASG